MTAHDPASWTRRLLQVAIIVFGAATMVVQVVLVDRLIPGTWVGFVGYLLLVAAMCALAARTAKPTLETWAKLFGMFAGWIPVFAWTTFAKGLPDNAEGMLVEFGGTALVGMLMSAWIGNIALRIPELWRFPAMLIAGLSIAYNYLVIAGAFLHWMN